MTLVHVEEVMGTVVSFRVHLRSGDGCPDLTGARALLEEACTSLHCADDVFSTWNPDSPMSRLRAGSLSLADAPPEMEEVLTLCRHAREMSRGWFDPWAMPGGVDPTGLVKGWAAARALDLLRVDPVDAAIVNAGGDIVAFGLPSATSPWRIGIRHPWKPSGLACVVYVEAAIATSATYERWDHLIDPSTGGPAARAASATVAGPDLAIADALATALAVGGDEVLSAIEHLDGYEGYLIRRDGSERSTAGIAFAEP